MVEFLYITHIFSIHIFLSYIVAYIQLHLIWCNSICRLCTDQFSLWSSWYRDRASPANKSSVSAWRQITVWVDEAWASTVWEQVVIIVDKLGYLYNAEDGWDLPFNRFDRCLVVGFWHLYYLCTMTSRAVCSYPQTTEVSRRPDFTVCSCLILHYVVSFSQEVVHGLHRGSSQWHSLVATGMYTRAQTYATCLGTWPVLPRSYGANWGKPQQAPH